MVSPFSDALICQVRFLSNYSMETNYFKVKSYKLASLENHKPDNIVLNSPISSGLFSKSRSKFEAFARAKNANNTNMDFMMKYRSKQMHFQRQTGEELTLQLMFYLVRD